MAIARPLDPPVEEVPFGDMVANESLAHQAILEQLRPFYPQIRRVRNSATQKYSFEYVFSYSDQEGFWSVPKPKYFHPVTGLLDRYGYFGVLYTPTINRFWTFTTQSLMIDVEGDDPQTQARKSAAKTMDSLYGPAVLGRFSDEEIEFFL